MLENERRAATDEREQLAGRIGLLERQIGEIEALPEDVQDPGALARLKAELVGCNKPSPPASARNEDSLLRCSPQ
jgi:hypothetical protein